MLGTILDNVGGITIGIDVETDMGSLDVSFDGSNDGKLEVLFFEGSFGSTDFKFLGLWWSNQTGIILW